MTGNYFPTLFICMFLSIGFLIATAILSIGSPAMTMIIGILPLAYYHLFYLKPRAKIGINQSSIDSVYYFGFLVTVAALGISAVTIAVKGAAGNVNAVVEQFGVGLFATGYAVVARMHLSSIVTLSGENRPEAIMDRFIKRSMDLIDNVELASNRMTEFSQTVMTLTTAVAETAQATAEKSMIEVAKIFEKEMISTITLARNGLIEIRGLTTDVSFVSEREQLARSIKATIETSTQLNTALREFTANSMKGAEAMDASVVTSRSYNESLRKLHKNIDELAGEEGPFSKSITSLQLAGDVISRGATEMAKTVDSMTEMAGAVGATGPTFKKMQTVVKKAFEQLEALEGISGRLDSALSKISITAEASQSLAEGLTKVSDILPPLATSAELLTAQMGKASQVSGIFEKQLSCLPQNVSNVVALSTDVSNGLTKISDAVEAAANHAMQLSANTKESSKAFEGANQLLDSASNLQDTIASLQHLLNGFASTVIETQKALAESSSGLKSSISASVGAFEADINRSSQAVELLVEHLMKIAEFIIDRTRQQQG